MVHAPQNVVVILTVGKSDNGKNATLAFSCGLSALALGRPTCVFLTSDGAVWGFHGSSDGIAVQGFLPLTQLIAQYLQADGRIILCSVCQSTCSTGSPNSKAAAELLPEIESGGFATILDLAIGGTTITF
jgi:predicted peroxiredoxin